MDRIMHLESLDGSLYIDSKGLLLVKNGLVPCQFIDYSQIISVDANEIAYIEYPKTMVTVKKDDFATVKLRDYVSTNDIRYILMKHNIKMNPQYKPNSHNRILYFSSRVVINQKYMYMAFFNDSISIIEYALVSSILRVQNIMSFNKSAFSYDNTNFILSTNEKNSVVLFIEESNDLLIDYINGNI